MGQQQLLLLVLGVIIVGAAIAVGIQMFKSSAQSSNRDEVINDLNNLAAKAMEFYRKPVMMAGGGYCFTHFKLDSIDVVNGNGSYTCTTTLPSGTARISTTAASDTSSITAANCQMIYIVGSGNEIGNDDINQVKAYVIVKQNTAVATILN